MNIFDSLQRVVTRVTEKFCSMQEVLKVRNKRGAMRNWKSLLKADPVPWLLEEDNPPVKYFTLIDILDRPLDDLEVKKTKEDIMKTGVVPKILAKQKDGGYWGIPQDFYVRSKYKGTVWTFIILAQLQADKNDERIRKTCEFILDHSQDRESGGFSYASGENGGAHHKILPCLTGNMVWGLIRFGYLNDPRVQQGIDWITTYQRFDDGIEQAPTGWPYKSERCWGKHTCRFGVVKALKALAEIPPRKRSQKVKTAIEKGVEYILIHHIYKRSHNLTRVSKPEWLQFGFPLMWNTDALEMLSILTKLNYKDKRMQEAVDLVISKQNNDGTWNLEHTYNRRFQVSIERKGKPSKWVTLYALTVLKRYS